MLFFGLYYASYQLHPNTVKDAQLIAEINKIVDIPTHRLIIDNIYYYNDGYEDKYVLTYRMRNNYDYTRYYYGNELLYILDQEGNVIDWGRGWTISFVGGKGSSRFVMPENKIILLQFIDGQVIEIDLEEYGYE